MLKQRGGKKAKLAVLLDQAMAGGGHGDLAAAGRRKGGGPQRYMGGKKIKRGIKLNAGYREGGSLSTQPWEQKKKAKKRVKVKSK